VVIVRVVICSLERCWLFNIEVKALDDPGKDSAAVSPALLKVLLVLLYSRYES